MKVVTPQGKRSVAQWYADDLKLNDAAVAAAQKQLRTLLQTMLDAFDDGELAWTKKGMEPGSRYGLMGDARTLLKEVKP